VELNVEGTRNVMHAAREAGVARVVFTSSVAAVGVPVDSTPVDERFEFNAPWSPYHLSKHLSEREALKWAHPEMHVVAVNPSVVFGAGNVRLDEGTMRAVWKVATGRQRFYTTGGMNVVDVEDVVAGHLAAAEQGESGQRYILGGENLSHQEVLSTLATACGTEPPRYPVPAPLLVGVTAVLEGVSWVTNRAPGLTLAHGRLSGRMNWFSSARAARDLGYRSRPFRQTADAMAAHLRGEGLL
jgi:dihydroflavonol-4-reductase